MLAGTLTLALNVLLIPGTTAVVHLPEHLAVASIALDEQARPEFATTGT